MAQLRSAALICFLGYLDSLLPTLAGAKLASGTFEGLDLHCLDDMGANPVVYTEWVV